MSSAIVLFRAAGSEEWVRVHTEAFEKRATTYATVHCGEREIGLQHANFTGHTLLVTDGENRVVVWPTGGNEPDDAAPKTMFDLQVVGHYDVIGTEGETYRIYHARHQNERRW